MNELLIIPDHTLPTLRTGSDVIEVKSSDNNQASSGPVINRPYYQPKRSKGRGNNGWCSRGAS